MQRRNTEAARPAAPAAIMELMPLAKLYQRLEVRQRNALQRELARLEKLVAVLSVRDARSRAQFSRFQKAFAAFEKKLTAHLQAEARTILPLIRRLESGRTVSRPAVRLLQTRARSLEQQHFEADEALAEVKELAANEDVLVLASSRVRTVRNRLAQFDRRLQEQIYGENRILFPRAVAVSRA